MAKKSKMKEIDSCILSKLPTTYDISFCTNQKRKLTTNQSSPPEAHLGSQTPKKTYFFAAGGTPWKPNT